MVIKCILLCTPTNKNILLKEKEYKKFCGLRRKNKPCPPQKRNPKRRALAPTPSAGPQVTGPPDQTTRAGASLAHAVGLLSQSLQ